MTRNEMLLATVAEECAEVAQRATKAIRFGLDEIQEGQGLTNAERIMVEFADLFAVMTRLQDADLIPRFDAHFYAMVGKKTQKIEQYLGYSQQCGTLEKQNG
jgi:hypothetical protein